MPFQLSPTTAAASSERRMAVIRINSFLEKVIVSKRQRSTFQNQHLSTFSGLEIFIGELSWGVQYKEDDDFSSRSQSFLFCFLVCLFS